MSEIIKFYAKHTVRYYKTKYIIVGEDEIEESVPQEVFDALTRVINHLWSPEQRTMTMILLHSLKKEIDYTRDIAPFFKYLHLLILTAYNEGDKQVDIVTKLIRGLRGYALTKDLVEYLEYLINEEPKEYQLQLLRKTLLGMKPLVGHKINIYDQLTRDVITSLRTDKEGKVKVKLYPDLNYNITLYYKNEYVVKELHPTRNISLCVITI